MTRARRFLHAQTLACFAACALLLTGCATHNWAPGPGMEGANVGAAKAKCDYIARHGGGSFEASGSTKYVVGAAVGFAIGESIRANQDFNDCMQANGWLIADQAPQNYPVAQTPLASQPLPGSQTPMISQAPLALLAPPILQAAQMQPSPDAHFGVGTTPATLPINSARMERDACVSAIHADAKYAILLPYLPDAYTGQFNVYQLWKADAATSDESSLLLAYLGAIRHCEDDLVAAITKTAPSSGDHGSKTVYRN